MSAIDWLSRPVLDLSPLSLDATNGLIKPLNEPETVTDASVPNVTVAPLGAPSVAGVGLLNTTVTGLPITLWETSRTPILEALLGTLPPQAPLPSAQSLLFMVLMAEAAPPADEPDRFLAARLRALSDRGAVATADEMLRLISDPKPAALAPITADLALLLGDTGLMCREAVRHSTPEVSAALKVYCLAQLGQWDEAVTTLEVRFALGDIPQDTHNRLLRFLDPELSESLPNLAPPSAVSLSALDFRLMTAAGSPLPSAALPLRFAVADLSGDLGRKARLEAAERLVRAGAIGEAQLFAAYSERRPAASGGVWDRAQVIIALDAALQGDTQLEALKSQIDGAFEVMVKSGLAGPFAKHYAPKLEDAAVPVKHWLRLALLTSKYERHAQAVSNDATDLAFERSIAVGDPQNAPDAQGEAIVAAWAMETLPIEMKQAREEGRLGELILRTLSWLSRGADGDNRSLTRSLGTLRLIGLEDTARRAALELRLGADTLR
ncbi:MAG: hypothetical protein MK098_02480 [Marinovum sp.]|nr:hypothetical protein [Marinovum sp.]